jgi:hypothetical protein
MPKSVDEMMPYADPVFFELAQHPISRIFLGA